MSSYRIAGHSPRLEGGRVSAGEADEQPPVDSAVVSERWGVLGGTFDPIHVGHLVAAEEAREQLALDRVLLVVAGDPWQKRGTVVASATDRLAMVRAAVEGMSGVEASDVEIQRQGPSYTVDTLEELAKVGRTLFLIVGDDLLPSLSTWHRHERIAELCTLAVVDREGSQVVSSEGRPGEDPRWGILRLAIPRLRVSSTDLRARIRLGRSIEGLVPPGAVRVIGQRGLYTEERGREA